MDSQFPPAPANLREQGGVNFDVRGIVRLSQSSWGCVALPTAVEIPLGREFRRLHVLHGTAGASLEGERAGVYRLHYDDGTSAELPILHSRDKPDTRAPTLSAPDSVKAAQVGEEFSEPRQARILASRPVLPGPGKWLYQTTYENSIPEREVVRITFESAMITSGPFLLALTVEP
jgi:hypothetical protein